MGAGSSANVVRVPLLGYNLLSLKRIVDRGHKYVREKKGVALRLENGKTLFGPAIGKLNYFSGFRRSLDSSNSALATIAPGKTPSVSSVVNTFHTSHGHIHDKLLRSTAKQLGVFFINPKESARDARSLKVLANRSAGQLRQGPIRYFLIQKVLFTLATSHGRRNLIQSLFL